MTGSHAALLVLIITSALVTISTSSDLVLVTGEGQPSEIFQKAISMMEDRDSRAEAREDRGKVVRSELSRRTMPGMSRRIKRKPIALRTVSSESMYNKPTVPRQRIKFSQRRVFSTPKQTRTHSPRPFSLLRNMHIKRRRRKFQPQTEAPFVEVNVRKNCEDKTSSPEKTEVINKLPSKPTYQAENGTAAESSPTGFLDSDTASSSERGAKTEEREREMFEEHEMKNQIQDKVELITNDLTDDGSQEEENLIIEESSKHGTDGNSAEDDSGASDEFFSEEVTTLEPFVAPVVTENLTN